MSQSQVSVGNIVLHAVRPEWGPGKVLVVDGRDLHVFFRDIREDLDGPATRKFRVANHPFVLAEGQSDPVLDGIVWNGTRGVPAGGQKKAAATKRGGSSTKTSSVWSQSRAIEEFLKRFPRGFDDPEQCTQERDYKWTAHERYQASLGGGQARKLYDQNDIQSLVERLRRVEAGTNLLFTREKMALYDGLKDESAACAFAAALMEVLEYGEPEASRFDALVTAARNLPAAQGKSDPEKWPVVTVFPFLAEPGRFMFLKPGVTKMAADRLCFNLEYDSRPNWTTFSRLHDMSLQLLEELRPHGAKDLMDVQTFIYVTGRLESKQYGVAVK